MRSLVFVPPHSGMCSACGSFLTHVIVLTAPKPCPQTALLSLPLLKNNGQCMVSTRPVRSQHMVSIHVTLKEKRTPYTWHFNLHHSLWLLFPKLAEGQADFQRLKNIRMDDS